MVKKDFKKIKNSLQLLFFSAEFISLRSISFVPDNKRNTKLGSEENVSGVYRDVPLVPEL